MVKIITMEVMKELSLNLQLAINNQTVLVSTSDESQSVGDALLE